MNTYKYATDAIVNKEGIGIRLHFRRVGKFSVNCVAQYGFEGFLKCMMYHASQFKEDEDNILANNRQQSFGYVDM